MGSHVMSPTFAEGRDVTPNREANSSGVSWGAVIGGAFVASSLYLILLALGAGFGLSAMSPWSGTGATAATVGTVAIVWMILIEIVSSAFGGYLTGRLRTKWTLMHTDEVFFRDTANGFLSWAVALVVSMAFLASAATSMTGSFVQGEPAAAIAEPNMYFADALFRSDRVSADPADAAAKSEAALILANDLKQNGVSASDRNYLAQLVAARTGMSATDADRRVTEVLNQARQAEDTVRETSAHFLLWLFVSLLAGAFSASLAATIGGRQRDHVRPL